MSKVAEKIAILRGRTRPWRKRAAAPDYKTADVVSVPRDIYLELMASDEAEYAPGLRDMVKKHSGTTILAQ